LLWPEQLKPGAVFYGAADILASATAVLRPLHANLIVTASPDADSAQFAPRAPHVLLLPAADLAVSQGGLSAMPAALLA
jgi:UDP:flavonoid glycosyltransferase YjiC (YdhE family)